jgi:hypothetical protein
MQLGNRVAMHLVATTDQNDFSLKVAIDVSYKANEFHAMDVSSLQGVVQFDMTMVRGAAKGRLSLRGGRADPTHAESVFDHSAPTSNTGSAAR